MEQRQIQIFGVAQQLTGGRFLQLGLQKAGPHRLRAQEAGPLRLPTLKMALFRWAFTKRAASSCAALKMAPYSSASMRCPLARQAARCAKLIQTQRYIWQVAYQALGRALGGIGAGRDKQDVVAMHQHQLAVDTDRFAGAADEPG